MVALTNGRRCIGKMFASCRSICEFDFVANHVLAQLRCGECSAVLVLTVVELVRILFFTRILLTANIAFAGAIVQR